MTVNLPYFLLSLDCLFSRILSYEEKLEAKRLYLLGYTAPQVYEKMKDKWEKEEILP